MLHLPSMIFTLAGNTPRNARKQKENNTKGCNSNCFQWALLLCITFGSFSWRQTRTSQRGDVSCVLSVFLSALKHTLLGWRCYEGQSTEWTVLSKTPVHSTTSRYSANRLLVHCRGNPYFDECRYTVVSWPQKSNAQTECSVIKATHSLLCNATAIGGWDTSTRAAFECADGQVA